MKIGVFDSGIGGLTILEKIREVLPNIDYIYYADSKNNPYGEKSEDDLMNITRKIVDYLIDEGCKIIVIACNTATTVCIKKLREMYPEIVFIGTEPAIKVARDNGYQNVLVLATNATIHSESVHRLTLENKGKNENIYLEACNGLANAIEVHNQEKIDEILNNIGEKYKEKNIDAIVLGCTHYPYVAKDIKKRFKNCDLLDGSIGVSKEVKRQLLKIDEQVVHCKKEGALEFINSDDLEIAKKARLNAYVPYSNFQVGVALRTKNGKVYTGCNIENHGIQSICAERTAFVKAISEGEKEFESITVVGSKIGMELNDECMPCGYCRQFMSEFVDSNFRIYTLDKDQLKTYKINDILPYSFKM